MTKIDWDKWCFENSDNVANLIDEFYERNEWNFSDNDIIMLSEYLSKCLTEFMNIVDPNRPKYQIVFAIDVLKDLQNIEENIKIDVDLEQAHNVYEESNAYKVLIKKIENFSLKEKAELFYFVRDLVSRVQFDTDDQIYDILQERRNSTIVSEKDFNVLKEGKEKIDMMKTIIYDTHDSIKLKETIEKLIPRQFELKFIEYNPFSSRLTILNKFNEIMNFYLSGQVKSYNHCRFFLDFLEPIIFNWNQEEKCGYWKIENAI